MADNKMRDWDKGFGDNAGHGAEKIPCSDCKYRKKFELSDGTVLDTGKGPICKKYPLLKPIEVMRDGTECPKFEKE